MVSPGLQLAQLLVLKQRPFWTHLPSCSSLARGCPGSVHVLLVIPRAQP